MATTFSFEKSLKPRVVEEKLDLVFYRPLAHRLVPLLHKLGFSPNQVTTLSLFTGLVASYLMLHRFLVLASLTAIGAIIFDCCDGQLARLTGKASPIGRILDGVFDLIWITCFWLALYFSGYFQSHGFNSSFILTWMVSSAAGMILHCWRFDGIKINYLEWALPQFNEKDMDLPEILVFFKTELRAFRLHTAFLAICMAFQMYFFVRGKEKKQKRVITPEQREKIRTLLDPAMALWPWLGESHHNSLIILGGLLSFLTPYALLIAIGIILIPMNLYWLYCEIKWRSALKKAEALIV